MELQKCVRCKKRQAIVFISHIENGVKKTGGFCLPCAKQLGIKQIDLQNEGIISQSHLSKIENGDINVSAIMLYKLAQRYGKDLSYFFK